MNPNTFKAPWGKTLRWVSVLSCLLLLATTLPLLLKGGSDPTHVVLAVIGLLLPGALLFSIHRYTIGPNELAIRRLLWSTRVPLSGLQSAEVMPQVMRGSLRLFGNGGLFSITGWYRNRALGNYRAFVTDLNLTVVLRFTGRTVVISPENPDQFVSEISKFAFRTN
jgi:hypothetical protein